MKKIAFVILVLLVLVVLYPATRVMGAAKAYDPRPFDGAGDVSLEPVLSWSFDGDSCNVYGGLSPDDLRLALSNTTKTSLKAPQTLPPDTVFYWRVDVNDSDQVIQGDLWSFRTESLIEASGCGILNGFPISSAILLLPFILVLFR